MPSDALLAMHDAPILVADDDVVSRLFIEQALKMRGFTKIILVESGEEALAFLQNSTPGLVILDIFMGGMSGLECCKQIRSKPILQNLPVLMLTSMTDEALRFQSFEAGATDFVSKPIHPQELYARVKVHLQNRMMLKNLELYKGRLDLELQSAHELQSAILPSRAEMEEVQERCRLEIASHMDMSSEIGGDFWGIKSLFPCQTAVWMVDFSGHGVAAAMNAFRLQAYLKEHSPLATRPGDYLSHLNDKLLHLLLRGHFATMFYGIIDTRGNRLHYACACSPHPLILRKDGSVEKLDGSGMPLGICMQFYPTKSIEFHLGDTLFLYSDALTETSGMDGKYISEDHLMGLLAAHKGEPAEVLKQKILTYFSQHSDANLVDDLTYCLYRRMD